MFHSFLTGTPHPYSIITDTSLTGVSEVDCEDGVCYVTFVGNY